MTRGGRLHIYNNLFVNVLNRDTDCRFGATAYIENNVFINCKKPVGSFEEEQGYFNLSGNIFDENRKEVPARSACDFTPSYEYILDDVSNLDTYLRNNVGVGKTDLSVAKAEQAQSRYFVDEGKFLITDENKKVVYQFDALSDSPETICIEGLFAGKYRLFTDIPSGS